MLQPPYSLFPGVPGSRRSSSSGQESSLAPRPGPGSLDIESVKGCDARKHPAPQGEAPWIELVPHPGKQECSVRVALRP